MSAYKWIIVFVAFDDDDVEFKVLKERIERSENEQLAAFLRGGELVGVVMCDDELAAEAERADFEKNCLR